MSTEAGVMPDETPAPTGTDGPEFRAWISLAHAYGHVSKALDRSLTQEHGISLAWFEVLARLNNAEGARMRLLQLSRDLVVSKASVTKLVDRMELAGLVSRETPVEDKRAVYAVLTQRGSATLARALPLQIHNIRQALSDLSRDELESLQGMLDDVIRGFNAQWRTKG
ncbi:MULTISPECIES: MarR family winged helix-turn-helix transcriptional regulator [unclassified Streptomyces]|uniref:MarR family winged helix-turn-helix transcriptional regulator n=1 Tax=unclassified Streptomyces TaxID=2593676 RepID=UPI002E1501E8|nr:MarR family transcriptional regulator [Streptomyces sp. NBC_01236]